MLLGHTSMQVHKPVLIPETKKKQVTGVILAIGRGGRETTLWDEQKYLHHFPQIKLIEWKLY